MTLVGLLAVLALLGQALTVLAVWWNHRNTPDTAAVPLLEDGEWPTLAVVVPARNEEANIGACVSSLCRQDYPGLRIRVVDDSSTDRTAEIVRGIAAVDARVELVPGEPLPPGWLGKNNALRVGARGLDADYVLFVDADLRVEPGCLRHAVAHAVRSGAALLTMIPSLETKSFWERAVQPVVAQLIYVWMPAREVNDPKDARAGAIGPFMLFRREDYLRIGGHEAVKDLVVEDLALAERIKEAGLRLVLSRGTDLATVRMYDSLPAIVRGWSKNFHIALGSAYLLAPLLGAGLLLLYAGPFLLAPLGALAGRPVPALLGLAGVAVALVGRRDLGRRYGLEAGGGLLLPVGAAVVVYILLRSAWRAGTGRSFDWKGRAVS